jgi:hypothetical protein
MFGRLSELLAGGLYGLSNGSRNSVAHARTGAGYRDLNNSAAVVLIACRVGEAHLDLDGRFVCDGFLAAM